MDNNERLGKERTNHSHTIWFSVGVMALGGCVISIGGFQPLWESYMWSQSPTCDDMLICKTDRYAYTKTDGAVKTDEFTGVTELKSRGIFAANDKIDYDIAINATKITTITKLYFLFASSDESPSLAMHPPQSEESLKKYPWTRLIEIPKITGNQFHVKNAWTTFPQSTNLVILIYGINSDGSVSVLVKSDVLVNTVNQETKVQDSANRESRIGNKTTLGLTWVGIGALPILLGIDLIARARLKDD